MIACPFVTSTGPPPIAESAFAGRSGRTAFSVTWRPAVSVATFAAFGPPR